MAIHLGRTDVPILAAPSITIEYGRDRATEGRSPHRTDRCQSPGRSARHLAAATASCSATQHGTRTTDRRTGEAAAWHLGGSEGRSTLLDTRRREAAGGSRQEAPQAQRQRATRPCP